MPGIPIALVRMDGTMTPRTPALVDSGCDVSNFPAAWAAHLGLDFEECDKFSGLTAAGKDDEDDEDKAPRKWAPGVEAVVMGRKIHLEAVFRPGLPVILLGREDFFQEFTISFDQRAKTFRLEWY